jgi:hypothetical protein
MSEFEMRAQRAGEAAREEARLRAKEIRIPQSTRGGVRRSRSRLMIAAGAATVLVGAVVLAGVADRVPVPFIEEAPLSVPAEPVAVNGMLPVPEVGEAMPAYLEDGRPVFVSHPEAGEVVVLDAVDPRAPWGWQHLVAYCSSSGWFEELRHGSRFDGWGEWTGGPSPGGLATYPSEVTADGDRVRVTGPRSQPPERRDPTDARQQEPRGPSCAEGTYPASDPASAAIYHRAPTDPPAVKGMDVPTGRWAWGTLVIGGVSGEPRVCDPDGTCDADALSVAGISGGQEGVLIDRVPRALLARRTADGLVEVILPATEQHGTHPGWISADEREPLFAVPPPGEVRALLLPDLTPVFLVHAEDAEVLVLEATSTANPTRLVGWCVGERVFLDARGIGYTPDGRPQVAIREGLRHLVIEVVEFGETRGVRITGGAVSGGWADAKVDSAPAPDCAEVVRHEPDDTTAVYEPGVQIHEERWVWARMHLERVDGELYLCAGSDQPCGEPGDPDAESICGHNDREDADTLECEPYRDPIVTTPGAEPFDTPRLMLVRVGDSGRTVEIRAPFPGGDTATP